MTVGLFCKINYEKSFRFILLQAIQKLGGHNLAAILGSHSYDDRGK